MFYLGLFITDESFRQLLRESPLALDLLFLLAWIDPKLVMETQKEGKLAGAGGTPGGIGMFILGFVLACAGGWVLTSQVTVTSEYVASAFTVPVINYRMDSFGLSLVPFIIGVGFLFFNGKSITGWLLTVGGLAIILIGIVTSLHIFFRPTSLFNTLVMLVMLFGGIGLMVRSLKASPAGCEASPKTPSS